MDTLLLSRIQFGANISFHILFPTITIALGWMLLFFKLRFNATGDHKWMDDYMFWHHNVLPIRHQLARFHGNGWQRGRAIACL